MVEAVKNNGIAALQQTLRSRGAGQVLVVKPGQLQNLKGIESLSRLPALHQELTAFVESRFGIKTPDILCDQEGKLALMAANPSFMDRVRNSGGNLEVLGHKVVWERSGSLFLLKNSLNIRSLSPTPADRLVLTPEEVQRLYAEGKMPAIGSMVYIARGIFTAGETRDNFYEADEKPAHKVEISPFFLSIYPVTNQEYRAFIENGGYEKDEFWSREGLIWKARERAAAPLNWNDPAFNAPKQPVVGVNTFEVDAYLKWKGQRLPTEHEWEYAARGGLKKKIHVWGDELRETEAFFDRGKNTGPILVNTPEFAPNGYGLFQMSGNVWEMVSDFYHGFYYQELALLGAVKDPQGPEKDTNGSRSIRGGGWADGCRSHATRVAHRDSLRNESRPHATGFRTAINFLPELIDG